MPPPPPDAGRARVSAFTLAEVLITLTIIGVVAALTMPGLIVKYQKQQTATKLKKAYTELAQTLERAEADNGFMDTWDSLPKEVPDVTFYQNYIKPYMSILKECIPSDEKCFPVDTYNLNNTKQTDTTADHKISFITKSGYAVQLWIHDDGTGGHFIVDLDGANKGPNMLGKDIFRFIVTFNKPTEKYTDTPYYSKGFKPYGAMESVSREDLLGRYGASFPSGLRSSTCTKALSGRFCAAVIAIDGWEIKDDYPW